MSGRHNTTSYYLFSNLPSFSITTLAIGLPRFLLYIYQADKPPFLLFLEGWILEV